MIIRNEGKDAILFADDLMEVERFLANTARQWPEASSERSSATQDWDMKVGYQGALKLARTGWSEGASMVQFAANEVVATARTSTLRYDVAGELPDVARFTAGDPLHMISRKKQKQNHPVVHLIVNVCCSGSISAKSFANYGGAVTALVDQIENTGKRVELDVVAINTHGGRGRSVVGWKVKQAADALDLAAVAYSIAHPAAFRRLVFGMWERCPRHLHTYGYGTVAVPTQADALALDATDAVLLDGVGMAANGVTVAEQNKRLAKNVEKALGIQILAEEV